MHDKIRLLSPNSQMGLVRIHSQTQQSEKNKRVSCKQSILHWKQRKKDNPFTERERERERENKVPVADKGPWGVFAYGHGRENRQTCRRRQQQGIENPPPPG